MSSLSRIRHDSSLQLSTKIRLYQAVVLSVLLYAAETWTLLFCDNKKTLEAFHMKCQCQILHTHWSQHITNTEVSARIGLLPIRRRHLLVFGHTARLTAKSTKLPATPSGKSVKRYDLYASKSQNHIFHHFFTSPFWADMAQFWNANTVIINCGYIFSNHFCKHRSQNSSFPTDLCYH